MSHVAKDASEAEKGAVHNWLIGKMESSVPFQSHWRVLDLDVGKGTHTIPMAKLVKQIDAFHNEQDSLTILKQEIKKLKIRNINVHEALPSYERLSFEDKAFDMVSCRTCIHYFSDTLSVFKEAFRVLKDDGILSIMCGIVSENFKLVWTPIVRIREPFHNHYHTYLELLNLLATAKFNIEKIIPYKIPRRLDEWVSGIKADNEFKKRISDIIINNDVIKNELNMGNLATKSELSVLKEYGVVNPKPGWWYWYNVAEIIATKVSYSE